MTEPGSIGGRIYDNAGGLYSSIYLERFIKVLLLLMVECKERMKLFEFLLLTRSGMLIVWLKSL